MGKGAGRGGGRGEGHGEGQGEGSGAYKGKTDRIAVPAMPMPMAVVCCILNFLVPGFGTILAGFSNFCCSRNEDIDGAARFVSCLINWGIGCAQLATAFFCLIGFCWSWAWGIYFIGMSAEYYHNNKVDDSDHPVITHQPQTVVIHNTAGYSGGQPVGGNVVMLNQPRGQQFGGKVVQIGGPSTVYTTGGAMAQPQPQPQAFPPAYSAGPPGKPSDEALYPAPPPYSAVGGAFPGTSGGDPAYPTEQTKKPL